MEDFKLYTVQLFALSATFTDVSDVLKIVLVVVSIGYTAFKWWLLVKNNKDEE